MANVDFSILVGAQRKKIASNASTIDFLSIKIGSSTLELKEGTGGDAGHFHFSAKRLTNIAAGSSDQDAATYKQLNDGLGAKISSSEKGAASGVCPLTASSKIDSTYLPAEVMAFKGAWNAETNSPELADGTGDAGDIYRVSAAYTRNLGSGNQTFAVGDWVMYNGSIWQKSPATDAVTSVNSKAGSVTLVTDDIAEDGEPVNLWFTASRAKTAAVSDAIVDGVTDVAPSQNAVYDALAGKAASDHNHDAAYLGISAKAADADKLDNHDSTYFATADHNHSGVYDPAGTAAGIIAASISDGDTTHCPDGNSVYDALAGKASTGHDHSGVYEPANANIQSHIASTENPHSVTKTQVGLGNVTNDAQIPASYLSTETDLDDGGGASNTKVPSQLAVKSYVDSAVGGVWDGSQNFTNKEGDTISIRQIVFIRQSDGGVQLAQATDDIYTNGALGVVKAATIADSVAGAVYIRPGTKVTGFSGLTPGARQYVSAATAGALTETAPSTATQHVVSVGFALSATELMFNPEYLFLVG